MSPTVALTFLSQGKGPLPPHPQKQAAQHPSPEEPRPHFCTPALSGHLVAPLGCPPGRTVRADMGSHALACWLLGREDAQPSLSWPLSSHSSDAINLRGRLCDEGSCRAGPSGTLGHKRGDGAMGCEDEVSPWVRKPHPGLVMASAPPPLGV